MYLSKYRGKNGHNRQMTILYSDHIMLKKIEKYFGQGNEKNVLLSYIKR